MNGKIRINVQGVGTLSAMVGEFIGQIDQVSTYLNNALNALINYMNNNNYPSSEPQRNNLIQKENESIEDFNRRVEDENSRFNHANALYSSRITAVNLFNANFTEPIAAVKEDVIAKYNKVIDFLGRLEEAANNFNDTPLSLHEAIEDAIGGDYAAAEEFLDTHNLSIAPSEDDSSIGVLYFTYEGPDGEEITIPLADAVNAYYTYAGTTLSSAVAFGLSYGGEDGIMELSEDESALLSKITASNGNKMAGIFRKGYTSIVTDDAIALSYMQVGGKDATKNVNSHMAHPAMVQQVLKNLSNSFKSKLEEDSSNDSLANKLATALDDAVGGAMAAAGIVMSSQLMNTEDENGKKVTDFKEEVTKVTAQEKQDFAAKDEEIKNAIKANDEDITEDLSQTANRTEEIKKENLEENTDAEQLQQDAALQQPAANGAAPVPPVGGVPPATGGMPDGQIPPDSSVPDGFEQLDPNGPIDPNNPNGDLDVGLSDQEANDIKDQMADIGDDESLGNVEADKPTSSDIDKAAKDEYFEKNEDYIDQRVEDIDRYSSMSIEEKQQALQDLGYSAEDAAELAGNDELGITAYLSGKQNNDLADISNDIAANQGVSGHDTSYDDNNNIGYVQSGEANVDLKGPSKEIHAAREQLDNAKLTYDNTVTSANAAIDRANVAKQNYDVVVNDITSKSGTDPKKWSEADVNRYNNAAKDYNKAVGEANEATKKVDNAKENYNKSKKEYNDTYDKWKKESQEEVKEAQESLTDPDNTDLNGGNKPAGKPTPKPEEKPTPSEGNGGNSSDKPEVSGDGGSLELGDGEATGGEGEEKPQVIVPEGNGTDGEVVEGNGDTPNGNDDGFSSITNDENGKSTSAQASEDVNPGGDTITSDDLSEKPTGGNPVDEKPVDNYVPDDFTDMN